MLIYALARLVLSVMSATPGDSESAPLQQPLPPPIYIGPPFPPPTQPYDFRDYNTTPRISYIRSQEQAKSVLAPLLTGPLGFDLEWRPTYVKGAPENPVALIQLANDHSVMLFQVSCMKRRTLILIQASIITAHILFILQNFL